MGIWHYRACRKYSGIGRPYWCIVEFFPKVKDYGNLWSANPEAPLGDNKKELIKCLEMMLKDIRHYPVVYDNGKKPKKEGKR